MSYFRDPQKLNANPVILYPRENVRGMRVPHPGDVDKSRLAGRVLYNGAHCEQAREMDVMEKPGERQRVSYEYAVLRP